MMKYIGLIATIITAIGITFLIFNSVFQTFEFLIKYQLIAYILLILAFNISILYSIIENLDGK